MTDKELTNKEIEEKIKDIDYIILYNIIETYDDINQKFQEIEKKEEHYDHMFYIFSKYYKGYKDAYNTFSGYIDDTIVQILNIGTSRVYSPFSKLMNRLEYYASKEYKDRALYGYEIVDSEEIWSIIGKFIEEKIKEFETEIPEK